MLSAFSRTELIFGKQAMEILSKARVILFGVGGVGGYAAEALARSGVGEIHLVDDDKVSLTNINRQLHATRETVGSYKVDVAARRILDINPEAKVTTHKVFYLPETQDQFHLEDYDYVVDAIDTVSGKIALVLNAQKAGTPIISAMGAGNKLDPCAFEVADIYKTSVCPLARVMRNELKRRGVRKLKVVYSKEKPITPVEEVDSGSGNEWVSPADRGIENAGRRQIPGSCAFVPPVVGMIIAGEVVKDLTGMRTQRGR